MRAESGSEDEEGAGWRLSLLALSTLMYFPYSTETHIAKRGKTRGSGGCTACVRAGQGGDEGKRILEREARISTAVFVLWSVVVTGEDDVVFLSRRTLTFVSDI